MWQKGKDDLPAGWLIYDMDVYRPYIFISWPDQKTAISEWNDLLRPYGKNSEWRKRLHIVKAESVEAIRVLSEFLRCF